MYSIPITPGIVKNPDLCLLQPGRGQLLVPIRERPDLSEWSERIFQAIRSCTPIGTSHHRRSYFLAVRSSQLVYGSMRTAVRKAVEAYNTHSGRVEHAPVINHNYLERWFMKYKLDREEVLSDVGVAHPGHTTLSFGTTRRGGRYLAIASGSPMLHDAFVRYWKDVSCGRGLKQRIFELVIDVTLFTALQEMNRTVLYHQLMQELGWHRVLNPDDQLRTLLSGINTTLWLLYDSCAQPSDGTVLASPVRCGHIYVGRVGEKAKNRPIDEHATRWPSTNVIDIHLTAKADTGADGRCDWLFTHEEPQRP